MIFSSLLFLTLFLPTTIILYYLSPHRFKNYFLLISSILFYSWGEPQYIFLMLFSIVINYFFSLIIDKHREDNFFKNFFVSGAILTNLFILSYFKYAPFLIENLNSLLGTDYNSGELSLPIGISFYTFQAISYIIDVSRNKELVQRNIFTLALYISLFPQLIAGPIVRYKEIASQLKFRKHSVDLFSEGAFDFIIGLGKKVIIANQLAVIADNVFGRSTDDINFSLAWIGIIAYTLQIYFDFSGYSNMATGLGKMFGFKLPNNFNYPYISKSITEFWRRWHITLGTWFRDYVYIPLGGNRVKKWRLYINLFIVWFLTGLWHGPNWTFVVWGLYFGLFIVLEKSFLSKHLSKTPFLIQHLYTSVLFIVGWVFFRSSDLTYAFQYLSIMFDFFNSSIMDFQDSFYYIRQFYLEFLIALIGITPLSKKLFSRLSHQKKFFLGAISCSLILVYCIFYLTTAAYNPFIYFRF